LEESLVWCEKKIWWTLYSIAQTKGPMTRNVGPQIK